MATVTKHPANVSSMVGRKRQLSVAQAPPPKSWKGFLSAVKGFTPSQQVSHQSALEVAVKTSSQRVAPKPTDNQRAVVKVTAQASIPVNHVSLVAKRRKAPLNMKEASVKPLRCSPRKSSVVKPPCPASTQPPRANSVNVTNLLAVPTKMVESSSPPVSPDLSTAAGSDVASPSTLDILPCADPEPFVSADAQECLALSQQAMNDALSFVGERKGWKDAGVKSGVVCSHKNVKKAPCICKGYVTFDPHFKPEDIVNWIWDSDNLCRWDPSTDEVYRVNTWSDGWPGLCTYYQSFKGQFGRPGRDFCLLGAKKMVTPDHFISVAKSIDKLPQMSHLKTSNGFVRGTLVLAAMDCQRMADGRIRLTVVNQVDVKEKWAPDWLLNQLYVEQLTKLASIKSLIEADHKNGGRCSRLGSCHF